MDLAPGGVLVPPGAEGDGGVAGAVDGQGLAGGIWAIWPSSRMGWRWVLVVVEVVVWPGCIQFPEV